MTRMRSGVRFPLRPRQPSTWLSGLASLTGRVARVRCTPPCSQPPAARSDATQASPGASIVFRRVCIVFLDALLAGHSYLTSRACRTVRRCGQAGEAAVPVLAGFGEPADDGRQRFRGGLVADLAAVAFGAGEAGFDQRLEMFHDRLAGERGVLGQPRGGVGALLARAARTAPGASDRRAPRTDRRGRSPHERGRHRARPQEQRAQIPAEAAASGSTMRRVSR